MHWPFKVDVWLYCNNKQYNDRRYCDYKNDGVAGVDISEDDDE